MLRLAGIYEDRGIEIVRGENQYVWDSEGRRYLDLHTGHGAAFLGHSNPRIIGRLREQAGRLMVLTPAFRSRARDEMLEELSRITPGDWEVYMQNSGAEAVELALKIAIKATGRRAILAFTRGFHGRTLGALSATWNPRYRGIVEGYGYRVRFSPYNDPERLWENLDEDTAAIIVELVQGEGGVIPAEPDFAAELRRASEETGALLIVDDVQAGFGRTGCVWSWQCYGIVPDIFTAGKSIAGGYPASLVLAKPEYSVLKPGEHGSTFGGNPLAASLIAEAARILVDEDVPGQAARRGEAFASMLGKALRDYRIVRGVRGRGLMLGADLRRAPGRIIRCLQEGGVLALKAGATVVRFLPPYMLGKDDMEEAVEKLEHCISRHGDG